MADTLFELYGAPTGNCLRAAIALEEARIPYRARLVELRQGAHFRDEFLRINPAGKVPVLVCGQGEEKFHLAQSNAIVFYAAEKAPGTLMPISDADTRAVVYERYFYFLTDVIAVGHAAFQLGSRDRGDSARLLNRKMIEALMFSERFVLESRYMAGDAFTIADIAAATITASLAEDLDWRGLPNLKRWFEDVINRPAVLRGMSAFS